MHLRASQSDLTWLRLGLLLLLYGSACYAHDAVICGSQSYTSSLQNLSCAFHNPQGPVGPSVFSPLPLSLSSPVPELRKLVFADLVSPHRQSECMESR
jgi:hypothetical protein